ncbi:dolichyl-diphosphooligosaccharide--protein glycosyltransferase subunit 1 [Coniosporium apollinis]|uniref:Dolichyl-diphosphooligosaccharide--protein glycosyltransferase subunit 1 n=1 Tax=Coniosporium apollinis TaxID=61459 RepID=A0ABQ9P4K9_9PEZI|nr:dolichyl-diphosphooligosaccharide--protein glycosyltransferase subunit 1 [Coniosporium apollinis]
MRSIALALSCLGALFTSSSAADSNLTKPLSSKQILSSSFKPPQVFRNVNLVRNVNLDKEYPRETINVIIENVDAQPQAEYYLPFEAGLIARVGGLEVRDKKDASKGAFQVEVVEYDTYSPTEFYLIHLPEPLAPSAQQTLSISYTVLSALEPLPASIGQMEQQYVQYTFSAYTPSAYPTSKQKTKIKFPSANIPNYTILPSPNADGTEDPQRQGSTFTYGPYSDIPAGAAELVSVRYEFTKPLIHATLLERDIEVSHWGGNLATEERYWLVNRGATLKNHFSRVQWQMAAYANPPTSALKELKVPLHVGVTNPYFTDDIGNVSTSRFRSNDREALLELRPRYPVFGGWKYSFRIGWDADLSGYLRRLKTGDGYVLKVPFLEGPRMAEGVEYGKVVVRVVLPEGAKNVKYETSVPLVSSDISLHRTFMDTHGRTTLKLTALNLVDEWRDRDIVVTYDYPWTAGFRKPLTIFAAVLVVFAVAWAVGSVDTSIAARQKR